MKENKDPTPVELLKMFAEGAKIRRKTWSSGEHIYIENGKIISGGGINYSPDISTILDGYYDGYYELYEAPKKLKRYWLWDVKTSGTCWYRPSYFMDENGKSTTGYSYYSQWQAIEKRKAEPEQFIDVEVES